MNGFGITWKRTAGGPAVPVGPGIYFTPGTRTSLTARAAALSSLLPPDAVIARRTAAWIWGIDVLPPDVDETDWDVELVTPGPAECATGPPAPDHVDVPPGHVREEAGVRVTSRARTALDCTRWLPRSETVAALDQFLRNGVDTDELRTMARTLPGYHGYRRLRELLRLGDRGAASPGESWVRTGIVDAGFPRPRTQVLVGGPHDRCFYVDLGYEEYRVGIEYDGERHHTGRAARTHDESRRRWLQKEMGWQIIPVTKLFLSRPAPYLEALLNALLQRGWKPDDATMNRIAARLTSLSRRRPR